MSETLITCPNCSTAFPLTESLAAPLVASTRRTYEQKLAHKESEISQREEAIAKERESLDDRCAAQMKEERAKIAAEEAKKARVALGNDLEAKAKELKELHEVLQARDAKLQEAQNAQAELIRKQRELDDAKRELELTIEKKVQESLGWVRDKARKEVEDEQRLKVSEKEEIISGMQRTIEELRRKADQGSQQLQGEVLELELEALLRAKFPSDAIEPVPKGELGADLLQRVFSAAGQACGSILWESKRTKNWSDGWLGKLREDQRAVKADLALIVSQALPKGTQSFALVDNVWIAEPRCAISVAMALRHSLIEIAGARQAGEGQQTKMQLVYQYLTGPRFRHRVEAIVEKFSDMQEDLEKERRATTRLWAKREEQIRGVIESTAGMYGDLQGIAGRSLQEIEGLRAPALEGGQEMPGE